MHPECLKLERPGGGQIGEMIKKGKEEHKKETMENEANGAFQILVQF